MWCLYDCFYGYLWCLYGCFYGYLLVYISVSIATQSLCYTHPSNFHFVHHCGVCRYFAFHLIPSAQARWHHQQPSATFTHPQQALIPALQHTKLKAGFLYIIHLQVQNKHQLFWLSIPVNAELLFFIVKCPICQKFDFTLKQVCNLTVKFSYILKMRQ